MSDDSKVLAIWAELVQSVQELQKDVEKNSVKRNVSAGVRVRKGLRQVRKLAAAMLKETLRADVSVVETRKATRSDKKA